MSGLKRHLDGKQRLDEESSPHGWLGELSEILVWLNHRAFPITALILTAATIAIFNYILVEKIPLTITSPGIVTALPAISALIFFIAACGIIFGLIPCAALLIPVRNDKKSIIDWFSHAKISNIRKTGKYRTGEKTSYFRELPWQQRGLELIKETWRFTKIGYVLLLDCQPALKIPQIATKVAVKKISVRFYKIAWNA